MKYKIGTIVLAFLLLCGCQNKAVKEDPVKPSATPTPDPIVQKVEAQLQKMSLEEKIGQMLFVAYRKPVLDETVKNMLQDVKPGGFILFHENFSNYTDSLAFVKAVKETGSVPLFIGIDQEGGLVQRLSSLTDQKVTKIPQMYYVGAKGNTNLTKEVARVMAEEMRVFGINIDFAPSLDIYSNPNNTVIGKRAFGKTPDTVSLMATSFGSSLKENGIVPVYKHFPGHGNTSTDSHYGLPVVTKTLEELDSFELIPFKEAIQNGAEVMMVGHLAVPSITGDNTPASLSKILITDILKTKMGFNGLVVTDAVDMEALTKYYSYPDIYEKAILAGVDLLLMPPDPASAVNSIKNSIDKGTITIERIDESVKKILTFKYKNIESKYNEYLPNTYLGNEDHQNVIKQVTG